MKAQLKLHKVLRCRSLCQSNCPSHGRRPSRTLLRRSEFSVNFMTNTIVLVGIILKYHKYVGNQDLTPPTEAAMRFHCKVHGLSVTRWSKLRTFRSFNLWSTLQRTTSTTKEARDGAADDDDHYDHGTMTMHLTHRNLEPKQNTFNRCHTVHSFNNIQKSGS